MADAIARWGVEWILDEMQLVEMAFPAPMLAERRTWRCKHDLLGYQIHVIGAGIWRMAIDKPTPSDCLSAIGTEDGAP